MPVNPIVLDLLEEAVHSGRSPEDLCADRPELLDEVRQHVGRLHRVRDELDALFPSDDPTGSCTDSAGQAAVLPEIPGHLVEGLLGRGGMGIVYRARQTRLNRTVAVKMMLFGGYVGPPELARFLREAESLAGVRHPNIVQVYEVGDRHGLPYFTMEFVEGGTLAQQLNGIPQPAPHAAALIAVLAGAVEAAHRAGIVHRDLKPANVLLTADGSPKISDFGLARRFEAGDGLTRTGARVGTPSYMAPEQAAGHIGAFGPATDVYALGAILYEMLTGRPPFRAETAAETERQVVAEQPVPPSRLNARVSRDVQTICLKCLQKEPAKRYASADALGQDLRRFLQGRPIAARPVSPLEHALRWSRRYPFRTASIAGGLILTLTLLSGGWWALSARTAMIRAVEDDLRVATRALNRSDWDEAQSALERARGRLGSGGPATLRRRLDRAIGAHATARRLEMIRVERIVMDHAEGKWMDYWVNEYEKAFEETGVFVVDGDPNAAGAQIRASNVRKALVIALDDWALCAGHLAHFENKIRPREDRREAWLLEVARRADPDPTGWRDRFRDPSVRRSRDQLARLAASANMVDTPAHLLAELGELLQKIGGDAIPFLKRVHEQHPRDLWANFLLGYHALVRKDADEAIRYLQAAVIIQPGAKNLYDSLGAALMMDGRNDEAAYYLEKSTNFYPKSALMRMNVGICYLSLGRIREAIEQFERSLTLSEDAALSATIRQHLRHCQVSLGRVGEAQASWRTLLQANPPQFVDWDGYAELCLYLGHHDEYRATCRELLERFGATQDARTAERIGRACVLLPASDDVLEQATALIDRALADVSVKESWLHAYFLFAKGLSEYRKGRTDRALSIMEGPAKSVLGPALRLVTAMAQHRLRRGEDALKTFASAIRAYDWSKTRTDDREKWIYHALRREAEAVLLPNLQSFLDGRYTPRGRDERMSLLGVCQFEGLYHRAAALYQDTFAADPPFADDLSARNRFHAACMAALASTRRGQSPGCLRAAERMRWRDQALDWLRTDLSLFRRFVTASTPGMRDFLRGTLASWTTDRELDALRQPDDFDGLPDPNRRAFQSLCDELAVLRAEVDRP